MFGSIRHHSKMTACLLVATLVTFGGSWLLTSAPADAGVMLQCNTMCSMGQCTVTGACSSLAPNTCAFLNESVAMANNANCTLGAVDGMAMGATTSTATPGTCSIYFANFCGATTMCTMGFVTTITGTCVVDAADGLPVELMGFSVESEDDDASPESPQ